MFQNKLRHAWTCSWANMLLLSASACTGLAQMPSGSCGPSGDSACLPAQQRLCGAACYAGNRKTWAGQ